jgi:hypothetical protein
VLTQNHSTRRDFLVIGTATAGAVLMTGPSGLIMPARAQGLAATPTMRGGANNYLPGAPVVRRIGNGGFWMTGTVRRAGDGAPLGGVRIQVWAHTTEGARMSGRAMVPPSQAPTVCSASKCRRSSRPSARPMAISPMRETASRPSSCVLSWRVRVTRR